MIGTGEQSLESSLRPQDIEQINRLERDWFLAVRQRSWHDAAALLPDDYTFISSQGQLLNKAQGLQRLEQIECSRLQVKEITVRNYGAVVVLVAILKIAGTLAAQDVSGEYCHTRVYVRRGECWTPVSGQSTRSQNLTRRLRPVK